MFKWNIRIYKNINWKEEFINKEFTNEKKFNKFIDSTPELKEIKNWETSEWPKSLFDINWFFDKAWKLWNRDFFKKMEKDLNELVKKWRKLLKK